MIFQIVNLLSLQALPLLKSFFSFSNKTSEIFGNLLFNIFTNILWLVAFKYFSLFYLYPLLLWRVDLLLEKVSANTFPWILRTGEQQTFPCIGKWKMFSVGPPLHYITGNTNLVADQEYIHRSPASHRRRWNGNPEPGGITGPLSSQGYKYGDLALQVLGVSNLRM
jgi:hypothetical protein